MWTLSHRADPRALPLADAHYNRQKPGTLQFVPPGACLVLLTRDRSALWVSSWPKPEYVKHRWPGAWICSCFRNEGNHLSSTLIREAVAITRRAWGVPPDFGFITFVDASKTIHKRDPGRCYRKAGWSYVYDTPNPQKPSKKVRAKTQGGLFVLQLLPPEMTELAEPWSPQASLFAEAPNALR